MLLLARCLGQGKSNRRASERRRRSTAHMGPWDVARTELGKVRKLDKNVRCVSRPKGASSPGGGWRKLERGDQSLLLRLRSLNGADRGPEREPAVAARAAAVVGLGAARSLFDQAIGSLSPRSRIEDY